jgi:hypothetical protein
MKERAGSDLALNPSALRFDGTRLKARVTLGKWGCSMRDGQQHQQW